jgi:UrcA family protein
MSARTFAALAASATLLLSTTAATAATRTGGDAVEQSTTVFIADLNLRTDAGVDHLYRRLKKAAVEVCTNSTAPIPTVDDDCRSKALNDAVETVHSALLSDLHARNAPASRRGTSRAE